MGRLYAISIDTIPSPTGATTWSSQANGFDNPGALDIEVDVFENLYGVPYYGDAGNSTLTIHGVSLADLQESQNYVGRLLTMKAGMSAGYPLANPAQAGTIMAGKIYQSFGNWIGTEMTLDFVIVPSAFTQGYPGNFVFNWQPGTTLQDALTRTLSTAYANVSPQPTPVFALTGTYAPQPNGHLGPYSTLRNLGAVVNSLTKAASPNGTGVTIGYINKSNTILVSDGAGKMTQPIQLAFTDLVGQPTWIGKYTMQFTTVMRADITQRDAVKMPTYLHRGKREGLQNVPGIVTTTAAAFPGQLKYKAAFQGTFIVQTVRHVGRFRDPNGNSWVSVFQAVPQHFVSN